MKKMMAITLAILCGALCAMVFSCDTSSSEIKETFTLDTEVYSLKVIITNNSTYTLYIDDVLFSTGSVSKNVDILTLTPAKENAENFIIEIDAFGKIINIIGIITPDDDDIELFDPGEIEQAEPVTGNWKWTIMDDSETAKWGEGISEINFVQSGDDRIPVATEEVINGKTVTVFHFEGTTAQKAGLTAQNYHDSAGWPLVGWMAVPEDEETWEIFRNSYAYSFYIRVNKNYKTYQTSVDNTIYLEDEGHEPIHWFGTTMGLDALNWNYTALPVGEWKKILCVYDPDNNNYNMDQAKWIYSFGIQGDGAGTPPLPQPKFPGVPDPTTLTFTMDTITSIKWQIQLQHNGGVQAPKNMEYMQGSNSVPHEFDVDFYGLELYLNK